MNEKSGNSAGAYLGVATGTFCKEVGDWVVDVPELAEHVESCDVTLLDDGIWTRLKVEDQGVQMIYERAVFLLHKLLVVARVVSEIVKDFVWDLGDINLNVFR